MIRRLFTLAFLACLVVAGTACAQDDSASDAGASESADSADSASETGTSADGMNEDQKTLYALGLALGGNLGPFDLSEEEIDSVLQGLTDAALGNDPKVDLQVYGPKIQAFAQGRVQAAGAAEREAGAAFLATKAEEAKAAGGEVTESGLVFRSIEEGDGASPAADDTVKVHYVGTLRTGETFDSSRDRGQPATFPLNQVIPCWTEGVQKLKVGGKAELVCPPDIAYGDQPQGSIPPGATLVFEVELLEIVTP